MLFRLLAVTLLVAMQAASEPARALETRYADGRASYTWWRPGGGYWTPGAPKIPGADTSRDGKSFFALHVQLESEGGHLMTVVSLLYGGASDLKVPVAKLPLGAGDSARVDALESFGLQPVQFAVVEVEGVKEGRTIAGSTISPEVDVRAELAPGPVATYRVRVTNRSPRAIMALRARFFTGDVRDREIPQTPQKDGPLVAPGETYTFEQRPAIVAGSNGRAAWKLWDRVEISQIAWLERE